MDAVTMDIMLTILTALLIFILVIIVGVILYALPATLSLPRGRRSGVEPLSIQEAAQRLRLSGQSGPALVEAARRLVGERMQYCRRNSFDLYPRAFARGYGYCQQSAYALAALLTELGFSARVVTAFRNDFPGEGVGGHAWVHVAVDGRTQAIDPLHYDPASGQLTFTPLTRVFEYTSFFRYFAGWGSTAVNAHRYYVTGRDS
jgi:transglutaminase-like putative cysteine protease